MKPLRDRIAELPPEKRALLERRLMELVAAERKGPTIRPRDPAAACPLSFSQERLWFLDQLEPGSATYNVPLALRLSGPLDIEALRSALDALVARHEVLRTTFVAEDGHPVQVIASRASVAMDVIDLLSGPAAERESELRGRLDSEARRPFDLARDLMLRAILVRLGDRDHALLLTLHHIASDAWSMSVLTRELGALYSAYARGVPPNLRSLPIQYADVAVWQRQRIHGEMLEAQLRYWRRQLASAPALELPTDRPRPVAQSFRGARASWLLPAPLTEALKVLGRRHRATLFMTLLAAVQTLLHRYTGQSDIVVGSPVAGRTLPETEPLIGFFVNNLVLRGDLSDDPSFGELLRRTRETTIDAYAHQDLPFEKLVEDLKPARNLGRSPLFQVMFALQNVPAASLVFHGLTVEPMAVETGTAKFDLFMSMTETESGLRGRLEYSTDLFDATTITRMQGHLGRLLDGLIAEPEVPISRLSLLTEPERYQLLVAWNATAAPASEVRCLHQLVEAQVARSPDAVAVVSGGDLLTYRALDARATQLARHLRRLGVGPDVLVGVALGRSVDMLVGLLGILKAGGAYVPLEPGHPPERLAYIVADAQVAVLLTQARLRDGLPAPVGPDGRPLMPLVCLEDVLRDDAGRAGAADDDGPLETGVTADSLAYVIYTSGSTGRPKGVEITHRAVANFLASVRTRPGLTAEDVLLAVTTVSFDIAGLELFLPLTVGARVVIATQEVLSDGVRLGQAIGEAGATVMQATPATWRLLLEAGWTGQTGLTVLCGGETLPRDLADALLARCGAVWNLYGPTETTIWSIVHRVERGEGPVPIGRPIANTQVYVLDVAGTPVPIGVRGELYIGGTGVARGYLNRPALTSQRFLPDPFGTEPRARLYRTGDFVRYRSDGALEFLGRADHQVKLRGHRIELGEIEAVLGAHPGVRQVVVVLREDIPGDAHLVAYVVPAVRTPDVGVGASAVSIDSLRHHARQILPAYMVPSALVVLETIPLTPNGKIDRRALPHPKAPSDAGATVLAAPRDALEVLLTKLWQEVLHVSPIGVRDNFFDLGGHSLLAVRLFAKLKRMSGRALPLAALFHAPTIEKLAGILRQDGWAPRWTSLVAIQPRGSRFPLFCIPAHLASVLAFRDLADALGPDQPVYGLEALGWDGRQAPHTRLADMAADYLREIRQVQPQGPYHLWGDCFGGTIALEMAQQLHARGETVGLLAVYQSFGPSGRRRAVQSSGVRRVLERWMRRISSEVEHLRWRPLRVWPRYARERFDRVLVRTWAGVVVALGLGTRATPDYRRMHRAFREAIQHYEPREYAGRIHLFLGSHWHAYRFQDRPGSWRQFARGGLRVHRIKGMPGSDCDLAAQLRTCLQEAHEEMHSASGAGSRRQRGPGG